MALGVQRVIRLIAIIRISHTEKRVVVDVPSALVLRYGINKRIASRFVAMTLVTDAAEQCQCAIGGGIDQTIGPIDGPAIVSSAVRKDK